MGLFARRKESRSISFQDVWGRGYDWNPNDASQYRAIDSLAISAVVGCVRHRVNLLAQLPMDSYRTGADGFDVKVSTQPPLIADPSASVVRSVWMSQMSISRDLWGNAFGAISARDAAGYPKVVDWLFPEDVEYATETVGGRISYRYRSQPFPTENMLLVPSSFNLPGTPFGLAPLTYAGLVDLGRQAQQFGANWFRNGAVPPVFISSDKELNAEQARNIADTAANSWRAGRPGVMGSGLKVDAIKVDKGESQVGDVLNHVGISVCQVFSVPPEEIGMSSGGGSLTYANRSDAKEAAVERLNGDLRVIKEVLTRAIPRPQHVEFNTNAYVQSSLTTRSPLYAASLAGQSWMTVDEVRKLENLPPMPAAPVVPPPNGGSNA
jgi:HK97 family phage portal protein